MKKTNPDYPVTSTVFPFLNDNLIRYQDISTVNDNNLKVKVKV